MSWVIQRPSTLKVSFILHGCVLCRADVFCGLLCFGPDHSRKSRTVVATWVSGVAEGYLYVTWTKDDEELNELCIPSLLYNTKYSKT